MVLCRGGVDVACDYEEDEEDDDAGEDEGDEEADVFEGHVGGGEVCVGSVLVFDAAD